MSIPALSYDNSNTSAEYPVEPGLRGTAVLLAHARSRGFLAARPITTPPSAPITSFVNRSMLAHLDVHVDTPKGARPSSVSSALMPITGGAVHTPTPPTALACLDAGTGGQIPATLVCLIEGYSFEGLERVVQDKSTLTPELQTRLTQVLNDRTFTCRVDLIGGVFAQVGKLLGAKKVGDSKDSLSDLPRLPELSQAASSALLREIHPDTGRVLRQLELGNEQYRESLERIRSAMTVLPEGRVAGTEEALSFFASKDIQKALSALEKKGNIVKDRISSLQKALSNPDIDTTSPLSFQLDVQIEMVRFRSLAHSISDTISALAQVDRRQAMELQDHYLGIITQQYNALCMFCLDALRLDARHMESRLQTSSKSYNPGEVQVSAHRFAQMHTTTCALMSAFQDLLRYIEHTPQIASGVAQEHSRENIDMYIAALKAQDMAELMGDTSLTKTNIFLARVRKIQEAITALDSLDSCRGKDRLREVLEGLFDKIAQLIFVKQQSASLYLQKELPLLKTKIPASQVREIRCAIDEFIRKSKAFSDIISTVGECL